MRVILFIENSLFSINLVNCVTRGMLNFGKITKENYSSAYYGSVGERTKTKKGGCGRVAVPL